MTEQEAVRVVRELLLAEDREALMELVSRYVGFVDSTFFGVLNAAAEDFRRRGKEEIASSLEELGSQMLKMKTLI